LQQAFGLTGAPTVSMVEYSRAATVAGGQIVPIAWLLWVLSNERLQSGRCLIEKLFGPLELTLAA
jgi:hypothetical protein